MIYIDEVGNFFGEGSDKPAGGREATAAEIKKYEEKRSKTIFNNEIFKKIEIEEAKQLRAERELRVATGDAEKRAAAEKLIEIDANISTFRKGIKK